jgi:hypothetical protein
LGDFIVAGSELVGKPEIEFVFESIDPGAWGLRHLVDWEPALLFPADARPNATLEVGGDLLPGRQKAGT